MATAQSDPRLKSAIDEKLSRWGKLTLVASPGEADLILIVQQTGRQFLLDAGNQAGAILRARGVDAELWSASKGGGFSLRGYSITRVGRAIADAFTRFYDSTTRSRP